MPLYSIRLTRINGQTDVADVTVTAPDEATARRTALAWGENENNEHEWSEQDTANGTPEVETVALLADTAAAHG